MISSKFRLWVLLPLLLSILLIGTVAIFYFKPGNIFSNDTPFGFKFCFSFLFFYFLAMMIFGELRAKAVLVKLYYDCYTKRGFLGIGYKKTVNFSEVDGYKISMLSSRNGTYEYFYIFKNGRKILKISEFYHANYLELKNYFINKRIKYLGVEQWNLIRETAEIFK